MTQHLYKENDIVKVINIKPGIRDVEVGDVLVAKKVWYDNSVEVTTKNGESVLLYPDEIEPHLKDDTDVTTINRADLPEVVDVGGTFKCDGVPFLKDEKASTNRRLSLINIAIAEFLEALEEAKQATTARRDRRANEYFDRDYADLERSAHQSIIDRLLALEDKLDATK